jgi:glucose/mannose-6-phosphate isomerase
VAEPGNGGRTLDDPVFRRRHDAQGMLERIGRLPEQLVEGWRLSRSVELPDRHRAATSVAVLGMGGSAIAGELVRGALSDRLSVPLVSVRDYTLPAWVGESTLVVAASHSGATEETITALSAALERRCPVVVVTSGGPIGEVAQRVDLPRLVYPDGGPPRAALGDALGGLVGLLERADLLRITETDVDAAAAAAREVIAACGPDAPTETNLAKQLAWTLLDRLPVIEASGALAAAARRWKTQLNENGKSAAVVEDLPEATHNAIVGYAQPEVLHDHLFVVFLAGSSDHARNVRRAEASAELLRQAGIAHQQVTVPGADGLAQAFAGAALGDYVSVYLALLYGLDPTPVEAILEVKRRLAGGDEDEDD